MAMHNITVRIETTPKAPEVDPIFQGPGRWSFASRSRKATETRPNAQTTGSETSVNGIFASYYG